MSRLTLFKVGSTRWRTIFAVPAAMLFVMCTQPATKSVAQGARAAEPPTIEHVSVEAAGASRFDGQGRAGDVVNLLAGTKSLGEATVAADGRWHLIVTDGLPPGTHEIRARARSAFSDRLTAGDEIRVAIPLQPKQQANARSDREVTATDAETEQATRQRAERLADGAGKAYEEITSDVRSDTAPSVAPPNTDERTTSSEFREPTDKAQPTGQLSVMIEWLKRAARVYREDVVDKLAVPTGQATGSPPDQKLDEQPAPLTDAKEVAETIVAERAQAEARRHERAEADATRKAVDAVQSAADKARNEALKRKQAEDLARRKLEADKRIADELERLKKAKEEVDKAKSQSEKLSTSSTPPNKAAVTLERFYLPGEKRPDQSNQQASGSSIPVKLEARGHDTRSRSSDKCAEGKVTYRKGRRWYVTDSDDTLWDIAERFYGSGLAYRRIYRINRKKLSSPHVVRPCLMLRLPGRG